MLETSDSEFIQELCTYFRDKVPEDEAFITLAGVVAEVNLEQVLPLLLFCSAIYNASTRGGENRG